jgi:hypothetical protein
MKTVKKRGAGKPKTAPAEARRPLPGVAVVRVATATVRVVSEVEERLSAALARLARLNAEHDALRDALADFDELEADRLGDVLSSLHRARQVERRLGQLDEELRRSRSFRRPERGRRADDEDARAARRRSRSAQSWLDSLPPAAPALAEPEWDIKALYRRLARRLHPDAARNDEERTRRGRLMIRLNAAFAAEDRVRLELLAAEIDQGEGSTFEDPAEAESQMERRLLELVPLSEKVERELRRTRTAAAYRRLEEWRASEKSGGNYFHEVRERTLSEARAARATFATRAARIEEAVKALNAQIATKARSTAEALPTLEPPLPYRRAVDAPSADTDGVFGAKLRGLARESTWKATWVVASIFAEIAGRPPAGLATFSAWASWHETLRAGRRGVPSFDEALTELPSLLEVGCRVHRDAVRFGVMLRDPDGGAFDPEALAGDLCGRIAADVLTALAPRATCTACERVVPLVHVHRLQDVDPLHALVCSSCGEVAEKYRAVGRSEGFEALAPYAVAAGVVEELAVSFGGATFRIGLLKKERSRLTSARLGRIFREAALGDDTAGTARALAVRAEGRVLAPGERVPRGAALQVGFRGKGPSEKDALAAMRLRHRKRFRQG